MVGIKRAVVDVDDFVLDFLGPFTEWMGREHSDLTDAYEQRNKAPFHRDTIQMYNLAAIMECSTDRQTAIFDSYYKTPKFRDSPPLNDSPKAIHSLIREGYEIIVATSRPASVEDITRKQFDRLGIPVREYHFCNGQSVSGRGAPSKGEICATLGAHYFMDDSASQVADCIAKSPKTKAFLLDARWNRSVPFPKGVRQPSIHSMIEIILSEQTNLAPSRT